MPLRAIVSVGLAIVLAVTASRARADWTGHADFTACPRQYIAQSSGSEGPFATEAACTARINQVQRETPLACARFTCKDNSVGGRSGNDDPVAQAISAGLRTMTPQQMMGASLGILGAAAILQGLNAQQTSDQDAAAAQRAAAQRQQEQLRQEQERRAEQTKQELLHSLKGTEVSTDLGLKDTGSGPDTGADSGLRLKTGDPAPPATTVIHGEFSLPTFEAYQR